MFFFLLLRKLFVAFIFTKRTGTTNEMRKQSVVNERTHLVRNEVRMMKQNLSFAAPMQYDRTQTSEETIRAASPGGQENPSIVSKGRGTMWK